jgi:hypothetical protein
LPKVWDSISSEEIRLHGILKNCRLSREGLTLVVDYEGQPCNGLISSELSPRLDLAKLHHFLLPHYDKSMQEVDSLDWLSATSACTSP